MKKILLTVAIVATLISCKNNKIDAANSSVTDSDSTALANAPDSMVVVTTIVGEWVVDSTADPTSAPAPKMSLKPDHSAQVTNVPATKEAVKATKAAMTKGSKAKMQKNAVAQPAAWKQGQSANTANDNGTLILFASAPGKHDTDSVVYEIVNVTDSTLTIEGEAGVFKFKKF